MTDVLMPALSPTMEEGTLAKWHVKKGDAVKIRGTWSLVQRANPKTVRIQVEPGWDLSYPWAEVQDHKPAAE